MTRLSRSFFTISLLAICMPLHAARNVILIIGDGMDDQQITIARNYLVGASGKLTLDKLPVRSVSQVLTVDESGKSIYVADSANSATSMATGEVTSRGRISVDNSGTKPLETIIEIAEAQGLRTGLVATSSITDATPASFIAHMPYRFCMDPISINGTEISGIQLPACPGFTQAAGGPGSISEQLANSPVDVLLGGGSNHFDLPTEDGTQTVAERAAKNGYKVVRTRKEMDQAPLDSKLLGLFSPSTMPVRLQGEGGREAESPTPSWLNYLSRYLGSVELPEPMICEPNPAFAATPELAHMTRTAIDRLHNEQGFFLMVESASIDKQSHERKPCGSIGELAQLDEALQVALEYAEEYPETLILVTADHSQAAQLIPASSLFELYGMPVYTPGKVARIRTPEGSLMAVNYATNNFFYEEHTGAAVPLFANKQGLGRVPPMLTQPDIFTLVHDYLFEEQPDDD